MEQEDNQSLAQFLLMIFSAIITYVVSINLEGSTLFKLSVIFVIIFIGFIIYTSLIGRPWPRSYYKMLVCKGNDTEINFFFWTFYEEFELLLERNLWNILEINPKDKFAYLTLENNRLKVESEKVETLDLTCNLINELFGLNNIKNIEISKLNFQNILIARPKMNANFKTSTTKIIFTTRLQLKNSDFNGITEASEILNLSSEKENLTTYFSWPDEKEFLPSNDQPISTIKNALKYMVELFTSPNNIFYPIIRKQNIILDEYNKNLIYYVTIDAKWSIPSTKSLIIFKDAVNNFNGFLEIWNDTDTKAGVKHRFNNSVFTGLRVQDGINTKNYAKKISFFSEKDI